MLDSSPDSWLIDTDFKCDYVGIYALNGINKRWDSFFILLLLVLIGPVNVSAQEGDWIRGYYSLLFRSYTDSVFRGTDLRSNEDNDRYLLYSYLNIQRVKIYQDDNWRITGNASAWYRQDLNDKPYGDENRIELSHGAIQIDNGDFTDGFLKLGRIYNFRGLLNQRIDGGEFYFPITDEIDIDIYGGNRPYRYTGFADETWVTGGRLGYNFKRRSTLGFSWLLSHTDEQWDDQKIGGDWRYVPWYWLELSGNWGYDVISDQLYDFRQALRVSTPYEVDFRFRYNYLIPGLYIPKSSIFSVFSLAEEHSYNAQIVYHPGRQWTFLVDTTYIDYNNEGGQGGDLNFFTEDNAINGGYQWRFGIEAAYRHTPDDEISVRFERMLEADFGYTVTDLIRTNFDFRDYDFFNPPPEDEGFAYGRLENGFSSVSVSHWHRWLENFSHSLNFYYYGYDNPLFLRRTGSSSFSTNLTVNWKINRDWDVSLGGRYINSLADQDEMQYFTRIVWHF